MLALIPAEGAWLERVLDVRSHASLNGLTAPASRLFYTAQVNTDWGRRSQRPFALIDGDRLLASAEQYDMAGVLDGRPVRICGIGSLCTGSALSASDHARRLVEALLDRAANDGADVALLFLPLIPSAGAQDDPSAGFHVVPLREVMLDVAAPPRYGAPMTMVRGGEVRDLPAIVAMGRARAASSRFHLDRGVDFVQYSITRQRLLAGLGAAHARQLHFFIAEEGTTAAAYVVLSVVHSVGHDDGGSRWTLEECGDRDPSGARVGALLQALIAREPAERRPSISASLPPGFLPPQVSIGSELPSRDVVMLRMLRSGATPRVVAPGDVLWWKSDLR